MKIGVQLGATPLPGNSLQDLIDEARRLEAMGIEAVSMANISNLDAIMAMAFVARETTKLLVSTAVTPTFPRHPTAMAQQALTAQAAAEGRFTLGVGLSHQFIIEQAFGLSFDKPAKHMREYLQILTPLLNGEPANFSGEQYRTDYALAVNGAGTVPLLVAALGPVMLKLAGTYADGTVTWMTGLKTLESHIIPSIGAAASAAGRATPRISAGFPIALTGDVDGARETIGKQLKVYGQLPSYRAMLDREGIAGPGEVAIVGDEATLRAELKRLESAGVTEFQAVPMAVDDGAVERTLGLISNL